VYEIDAPDAEGSQRIALNIYREIRNGHDWGKQFPDAPSEATLERLSSLPPREMRRLIHGAFGTAKLAGRSEVGPDDIQDGRGKKSRIGF